MINQKFYRKQDKVILHSENYTNHPPILAEQDQVRIEGVVKGVIQYSE